MTKALVPDPIQRAMGAAAEDYVRVQLQLRCLQAPGWQVVSGGFGHDLALINTINGEKRTIEVKSRQSIEGLTKHNGSKRFRQTLYGAQTEADFLIFVWFNLGLTFIIPVGFMKAGYVSGSPSRRYVFSPNGESAKWLNNWDQLFGLRTWLKDPLWAGS